MLVSIANDENSRALVQAFLGAAGRSYLGLHKVLFEERRLPPEGEFSSSKGVCFSASREIDDAINAICARCHVRAVASHDQDVIDYLWSAVADLILQHGAERLEVNAKAVVKGLNDVICGERVYINDNHVIHLHSGPILIGPVRAIKSAQLSDILASSHPDAFWLLTNGSSIERDVTLKPNMSPVCWEVRLRAAPRQVEVRGEQLIGLALSILRFSLDEAPPLYPYVGDVETSSLSKDKISDTGIVITGGAVMSRGSASLGYWINYEVAGIIVSQEFRQRADILFDPPKNSVASRVSQGLIWHTRARRSIDRTERLLFFFTAIEALLTRGSSDPVTETICRFSSIMLESDPVSRERIYKRVKKLYKVRSTVAHSGSHAVTDEEADSVQNLAEALYQRVFNIPTLVQTQEAFIAALEAATHGAIWPPADTSSSR